MIELNPEFFKYFKVQEFVPKDIYQQYGEKSLFFLDPRMLNLALAYREFFDKPVVINNWHSGGSFQNRGYRKPSSTVGAVYSQHKFGRAFDCNIKGLTDKEVYDTILKNYDHFKQFGLSTLENFAFTGTWIHSDVRLTTNDGLLIVDPQ